MVKNYKNVTPKKRSRSLTGGGLLLEVLTARLRLGIVCCFGQVGQVGQVAHGGSTVF